MLSYLQWKSEILFFLFYLVCLSMFPLFLSVSMSISICLKCHQELMDLCTLSVSVSSTHYSFSWWNLHLLSVLVQSTWFLCSLYTNLSKKESFLFFFFSPSTTRSQSLILYLYYLRAWMSQFFRMPKIFVFGNYIENLRLGTWTLFPWSVLFSWVDSWAIDY